MNKPTKSFRLSKQTKRIMCSIVDDTVRNEYRATMIQAQLEEEKKLPKEKRPAGNQQE